MISCCSFEFKMQQSLRHKSQMSSHAREERGWEGESRISSYSEVIIAIASKFSDSLLTQESKHTSTEYIISMWAFTSKNQQHVLGLSNFSCSQVKITKHFEEYRYT